MEDNSIPGFRFYPTEEELISFYLHNKLEGEKEHLNRVINRVIPLLDIYEFNPWDLPRIIISLFFVFFSLSLCIIFYKYFN